MEITLLCKSLDSAVFLALLVMAFFLHRPPHLASTKHSGALAPTFAW